MNPSEVFGENVRRERRRAGLSQEALAHAIGIHMTEISRLERAERDPRLTTIVRVAGGLKIPPARLLDGLE